jgi:hypothetical protein
MITPVQMLAIRKLTVELQSKVIDIQEAQNDVDIMVANLSKELERFSDYCLKLTVEGIISNE